jgi:hypothetical protein
MEMKVGGVVLTEVDGFFVCNHFAAKGAMPIFWNVGRNKGLRIVIIALESKYHLSGSVWLQAVNDGHEQRS